MKTIILLITLILCNLSFSCEILPNGNYIPCDITEQIIEAESRLNEAEVRYVESIKKYKTARHNAASKSFKQKLYSDILKQKTNADIAKQKTNADIAKQKTNAEIAADIIKQANYAAEAEQEAEYEIINAKVKASYEMTVAEIEYENARWECGRIYALAKCESTYSPVGKSKLEIWKLIK